MILNYDIEKCLNIKSIKYICRICICLYIVNTNVNNITGEYMIINHKIINNNIYVYVEVIDDSEFAKEFLNDNKEDKTFITKLKSYVTKNLKKGDVGVLVINGVLIGSMSFAMFFGINEEFASKVDNSTINIESSKDFNISSNDEEKLSDKENENLQQNENITDNTSNNSNSNSTSSNQQNIPNDTSNNNTNNSGNNSNTSNGNNNYIPEVEETPNEETIKPVPTDIQIRLNTNGTIVTMNLEEYIIGVVAAEMPASFHSEALKSQAIAARTFAMKKTSSGITLLNSTTHQVYKNESQLRAIWGSSYDTYYNKIKDAVYDTKGLVLKYNGGYIDALYHSTSNGMTELPKYVWGNDVSYLQSVSSNWDKNVSGYEKTVDISYSTLSSKLGMNINYDTNIELISYTVSNRVDSIKIGDTIFSGVTLRTKLSLRSTDFTIAKTETGFKITTRGYGHGVGMSQYGANEAAKEGYSYSDILYHYYTGVTLNQI